jgi:hypothetical protein
LRARVWQLGGSKAAQAAQELRGAREAEAAAKEKAKQDAREAAAKEKDDEEKRKKADRSEPRDLRCMLALEQHAEFGRVLCALYSVP